MELKCILCCAGTKMILSNEDVKRIEGLGFDTKFFVRKNRGGYLQLKNKNGLCVFHNGIQCSIYDHRPEGCTIYPIAYDQNENCAVFDGYCPHWLRFQMLESTKQQLYDLIAKLDAEKAQRKKT